MKTLKLWFSKEVEEEKARSVAGAAKWICWLVMAILVWGVGVSISGRQTFILFSNTGMHSGMRLVDGRNGWERGAGFVVSMPGTFRVFTNCDDGVDIATRIALSVSQAVYALPLAASFFFLAQVLENVQKGIIFTRDNARRLLWFGRIQFATHLLVSFAVLGIVAFANLFSDSSLSYANDPQIMVRAIPFLGFNVVAYIILHGVKISEKNL